MKLCQKEIAFSKKVLVDGKSTKHQLNKSESHFSDPIWIKLHALDSLLWKISEIHGVSQGVQIWFSVLFWLLICLVNKGIKISVWKRVRNTYAILNRASLVTELVKNLPAVQKTQIRFLGQEDPPEKGMATHSSILAWRIPWTELLSLGLQGVRHDWVTNIFILNQTYHHLSSPPPIPINKSIWTKYTVFLLYLSISYEVTCR